MLNNFMFPLWLQEQVVIFWWSQLHQFQPEG